MNDVLVQLGSCEDRQKLRRPLRHAVGTPLTAVFALPGVAGHGQPQVNGQHHVVPPDALVRTAVVLSVSQHLPQFPAPGCLVTKRVDRGFRGRERGDLESAQYRLPVISAQPPSLGGVGAEFHRGVPAVQSPPHEQVIHLLPRFRQREDDLLQPAPQRCPPRPHAAHVWLIRQISSDASVQRSPVDGIDHGTRP